MTDCERLFRIARLLLDAGAEVREDFIYVEIGFFDGTDASRNTGLVFVKRLFSVSLEEAPASSGSLRYVLRPGRSFTYARTIWGWAEADLWKDEFPTDFWDAVYRMVSRVRNMIFLPREAEIPVTWDLWVEARKRHRSKPTRETLLLTRKLWAFAGEETSRHREARRKRNSEKQAAYEEMLRLAHTAPHSLNRLRTVAEAVRVRKITSNYWQVDAFIHGEEFSGWGGTPVSAASQAMTFGERALGHVSVKAVA